MYSNFIKLILATSAFAPILLTFWGVNMYIGRKELHFYVNVKTTTSFMNGLYELLSIHSLLILFIIIIFVCKVLLLNAINTLPIDAIEVKSIKPGDVNFDKFLLSYLLPCLKLATSKDLDIIIIFGFAVVCMLYSFLNKDSYYYNLVFRFFLGYYNYEIQTRKEVTYLLLSKDKIINPNQIKECVRIANHMIIKIK